MANRIALVTGGSRGLGKDMALRLAEKGNDVIITFHSQKESAEQVVAEIEKLGRKAIALQLDSSAISQLNDFVQRVSESLEKH
jgi:NAD(P)-dependent dehydrogenase (short-subunit alcohol dehydrogenase family)